MSSSAQLAKAHLADHQPPIVMLTAKSFFEQLTKEESLYAHYMSKASHAGSRVVLRQVSHESEAIFDLVLGIHIKLNGKYEDSQELNYYLEYVSQFLSNLGNYNSFGNSKFIPRCSKEYFYQLMKCAGISKESKVNTTSCPINTYEELVEQGIYRIDSRSSFLGFPTSGHVSGYYFGDVSEEDLVLLKKEVFGAKDVMPENTRIKKLDNGDFEILVASESTSTADKYPEESLKLSNGATLTFKFGDHSREMKLVADYISKAKEYAANDTQRLMLSEYVDHFRTGNMKSHKRSQIQWVKDLAPIIETNTGFIETYREPSGIIGEFESLVAITNKHRTRKFAALVQSAGKFISLLPWGPEFEKSKLEPPDFTSLEVLTFAASGIPAGINIPNYDDVRLNIGFKNVSLGNIVSSTLSSKETTFLHAQDDVLFRKYQAESFEVQVGIHELLGHGSGKLLCELEDGSFNFDKENPPIGLDGKPVSTYYRKGETWGSKFGGLAGPYEECRAEVIAMYLITNRELLSIFGFKSKEEQDSIIYIGFLQMARAGLMALDFWDESTQKWGQPHMQARFAIMKTFFNHSQDKNFLKFSFSRPDYDDLKIELKQDLIETVGHECMKDFLKHLHIYKASCDVEAGTAYFKDRSSVTPELARFKAVVNKKKLPRKQFIQANTSVNSEGIVTLHEYEATPLGMLQSFTEREY
ncbi:dipeptidyl-peptidase III Ecym_5245 [Eremothecium cymbalariae DBVPG|uniref:Dipeptidyl peptidase 3 n=1 Tax=Eremothecium cymbalariae (strain CBS 270.75 / DBVPG 7215 / KCTC 17166 / NRRL Y-17582) TaxID=931890 RepID=I6ND70_ERECY|nr:hypothetical protein Ecym_5245 [Eremothecium cymbalariae DBVPG\